MNQVDGGMRYSATDLLTWHGCAHASRLDALALSDAELADWLSGGVSSAITWASADHGCSCTAQVSARCCCIHSVSNCSSSGSSNGRSVKRLRQPSRSKSNEARDRRNVDCPVVPRTWLPITLLRSVAPDEVPLRAMPTYRSSCRPCG